MQTVMKKTKFKWKGKGTKANPYDLQSFYAAVRHKTLCLLQDKIQLACLRIANAIENAKRIEISV